MGVKELFADLLAPVQATACDLCDSCETSALVRAGGDSVTLRAVANFASHQPDRLMNSHESQSFAAKPTVAQHQHLPGLSHESQKSQGVKAPAYAAPWTDGEIQGFKARAARFQRRRFTELEAERLAEVLLLRDRDGDDRRMCLECSGLDGQGRCLPARRGLIAGAGRVLEPITTTLHRCEGFKK